MLHVAAVDDRSPSDRIGYRLTVVNGVVPNGIDLPTSDTRASQNVIYVWWRPQETGETFRFELSIAPVDEAGNVGGAQNVVVARDDGGGCSLGPAVGFPNVATAATIVIALALARRRRR